jgi:hypothetical protein
MYFVFCFFFLVVWDGKASPTSVTLYWHKVEVVITVNIYFMGEDLKVLSDSLELCDVRASFHSWWMLLSDV